MIFSSIFKEKAPTAVSLQLVFYTLLEERYIHVNSRFARFFLFTFESLRRQFNSWIVTTSQDPPVDVAELGDRIQFSHVLIQRRMVRKSFRSMRRKAGCTNIHTKEADTNYQGVNIFKEECDPCKGTGSEIYRIKKVTRKRTQRPIMESSMPNINQSDSRFRHC